MFLPHVAWYRHSKIVHIIFLFMQFLLLRCPSSCTGRGGRWETTRWWGGSRRDRSSRPPALYSQVSYKHLYLLVPLNRSSRLYTSKRQLFKVHAVTAKSLGLYLLPGVPGCKQEPGVPGCKQEPGDPGCKQEPRVPGCKQEPGNPGCKQEPGDPGYLQEPDSNILNIEQY